MTTDSRKGARRFLFVAPRYHSERAPIVGGAEVHSRAVVERLVARGHDVRVLTSCATSYKSWRNALPEGDEIVSGVRVTRFPTTVPRIVGGDEVLKWATTAMKQGADGLARLRDHDAASAVRKRAQRVMERAWIEAQGPMVPKLLRELPRVATENDVVVFYGYLYSTTIFGLPAPESQDKECFR